MVIFRSKHQVVIERGYHFKYCAHFVPDFIVEVIFSATEGSCAFICLILSGKKRLSQLLSLQHLIC